MKNWLKLTWHLFKTWIIVKIWAFNNPELKKQYFEDRWQKRAMKLRVDCITKQQAYIDKQKNPDEYFDNGSLFIGVIPQDWIERINIVIDRQNKKKEDKS